MRDYMLVSSKDSNSVVHWELMMVARKGVEWVYRTADWWVLQTADMKVQKTGVHWVPMKGLRKVE